AQPEHQGHQRNAPGPEHRARAGNLRPDHARNSGPRLKPLMVANTREYLVSYGKTGVLGRFLSASEESLRRGDEVVLQSDRGLTLGTVLCEANERKARMLAVEPSGQLLRRVDQDDRQAKRRCREHEQQLFDEARRLAVELHLAVEILDAEL